MKWTKRLSAEVASCQYWSRYVDEDWIIEGIVLWYRATSWRKLRRVAVIRKATVVQDDQACFLLDTDWQYEAIVTNLDWEAIEVWRFYNQRYCMENYIKEAMRGFSIDKIATGSFVANEIDLLIKLLAYNLYERFNRDYCKPIHFGYTVARFRLEFFKCAATLVSHSRTTVLKQTKEFANRHAWRRIESRIAQLE